LTAPFSNVVYGLGGEPRETWMQSLLFWNEMIDVFSITIISNHFISTVLMKSVRKMVTYTLVGESLPVGTIPDG
jgi:hypothetical protein